MRRVTSGSPSAEHPFHAFDRELADVRFRECRAKLLRALAGEPRALRLIEQVEGIVDAISAALQVGSAGARRTRR
jgi:hypothetical protein